MSRKTADIRLRDCALRKTRLLTRIEFVEEAKHGESSTFGRHFVATFDCNFDRNIVAVYKKFAFGLLRPNRCISKA
jgi:hypothetical protein